MGFIGGWRSGWRFATTIAWRAGSRGGPCRCGHSTWGTFSGFRSCLRDFGNDGYARCGGAIRMEAGRHGGGLSGWDYLFCCSSRWFFGSARAGRRGCILGFAICNTVGGVVVVATFAAHTEGADVAGKVGGDCACGGYGVPVLWGAIAGAGVAMLVSCVRSGASERLTLETFGGYRAYGARDFPLLCFPALASLCRN